MGQRDPDNGRDFHIEPGFWLAEAIDHLPVAIGLIDSEGRFIAQSGAMRDMIGPVIASRDDKLKKKWRVFDEDGVVLDPQNWPSERVLRGGHAIGGLEGIYMPDTDEQRRMCLFSVPFTDSTGRSAGLVVVQDMHFDYSLQGRHEPRYIETLVATMQAAALGGEHAHEVHGDIGETMSVAKPALDGLSPREEEVLRLMARGNSRKQVAAQLGIAVKTVEFHRGSAARKLALKTRVDVVSYAIDRGWMTNGS